MKKLFASLAFLCTIAFFSCHKDDSTLASLPNTEPAKGAVDRSCDLTIQVNSASLSTWDATVWGFINGAWVNLVRIGGTGNNNPGVVQIPTGSSFALSINGYTQYRIVQAQGNVGYTLTSPAGGMTKYIVANSLFLFRAGCEPIPQCSMTVRIGNACSTSWEAKINRKDANGNFEEIAHIGGLGSTAPTKVGTGKTITLSTEGYAEYQFLQVDVPGVNNKQLLTTNYIVNTPSSGQFSFTLDVLNGNNTCIPGSHSGTYHTFVGCL